MLQVTDLRVDYGNITALRGVSFEVREKEIVTIIGSNGAGKSSTLMAISNIARKSGGSVHFKGQDITSLKPSAIVRAGIGHVPEGRHIFPFLTVQENLMVGVSGNVRSSRATTAANLDRVYELFPILAERRNQNGGTLSGGEQQMLAIARALMPAPKLLLLDEPSLGLAPIIVERVMDIIRAIREGGTTVILVEQNAFMALSIADYAYVLETGRVVLSGTGASLLKDEEVRRSYLGV